LVIFFKISSNAPDRFYHHTIKIGKSHLNFPGPARREGCSWWGLLAAWVGRFPGQEALAVDFLSAAEGVYSLPF
jgi:hypothetical protein